MKILIRGGSISAGKGVKIPYPELIARETEKDWVIINSSKIGDTSFNGVWGFKEEIEIYHPDILMLHFGIEDAYYPVYRSEFKENLIQMVRKARGLSDPKIYLLTSHVFTDPYVMDSINIYYRVIREVALDLFCTIIPIHMHWAGLDQYCNSKIHDLVQADDRYPNELGHRCYSDIIRNYLLKEC